MRLWYFHFNKWIWELGDLWLYLGALLEKAIILRIQDILVAWILPQMDDILGFHCNRYRWMCSYFYMSLIVVLFWEIHNDRHYGRVVKATDLKSVGLCPRWFKSCWCRIIFWNYFSITTMSAPGSFTIIQTHISQNHSRGHGPIWQLATKVIR